MLSFTGCFVGGPSLRIPIRVYTEDRKTIEAFPTGAAAKTSPLSSGDSCMVFPSIATTKQSKAHVAGRTKNQP
jgi:hypothetical protein